MAAGPRRRLAAVVAVGLLPWTVLVIGGELTLVFPVGLVNTSPPNFVLITDFFFRYTDGLPAFIEAWGSGVLLYVVALVSALASLRGRGDPRITALALVGAGLLQVQVFFGFDRRLGYTAFPLGTVLLLAVAWWYYWPLFGSTPTSS